MEIINPVPDDDGGEGTIPKNSQEQEPRRRRSRRCMAVAMHPQRRQELEAAAGAGQRPDRRPRGVARRHRLRRDAVRADADAAAHRARTTSRPRPLTDVDVGIMQEQLQQLGLKQHRQGYRAPGRRHARQRVRFHPVRDYLDGLAWDGTRAHGQIVRPTTSAPSRDRTSRAIGRMFLIVHGGAHLSSPAARPTTCR